MLQQALNDIMFGPQTDEFDFATYVERIATSQSRLDELVPLLRSGHALYDGRGSNQIARMRGYLVAAFHDVGPPDGALVYILELLENSQTPYLVAAAARALRNLHQPSPVLVRYLLIAVSNIQYRDEPISFECYAPDWPRDSYTTALGEIVATLETFAHTLSTARTALETIHQSKIFNSDIRKQAEEVLKHVTRVIPQKKTGCCSEETAPEAQSVKDLGLEDLDQSQTKLLDIWLENQDGNRQTFAEAFTGKPTVLGFFYTRCGNPNKCSMTITRLAELKSFLKDRDFDQAINIAAITYDPGYDVPERLRSYCWNRGMIFDESTRAYRTDPDHFEAVRAYFELGVSYAASVVSRHEIEVYVLGKDGRPATAMTKLQLDVETLARSVLALV